MFINIVSDLYMLMMLTGCQWTDRYYTRPW